MPKANNLDWTARLVMVAGVGAAIYLIGVPLTMLGFAVLRGPADFLPLEPGAQWTLDNIRHLLSDPFILTRILPDTLVFVAGTVMLVFCIAFVLAWLVERTDLPGKRLIFSLLAIALLIPGFSVALGWLFLLNPRIGLINVALQSLFGLKTAPFNIASLPGMGIVEGLSLASTARSGSWCRSMSSRR